MPYPDGRDHASREQHDHVFKATIADQERRLDRLTALLCNACRIIKQGYDTQWGLSAELSTWYAAHEKSDKARLKKDRVEAENAARVEKVEAHKKSVRARLLTQLSDEEKDALGLTNRVWHD